MCLLKYGYFLHVILNLNLFLTAAQQAAVEMKNVQRGLQDEKLLSIKHQSLAQSSDSTMHLLDQKCDQQQVNFSKK